MLLEEIIGIVQLVEYSRGGVDETRCDKSGESAVPISRPPPSQRRIYEQF